MTDSVNIAPMPEWCRGTRFKPTCPPIFPAGPPTPDEIELARALFMELDPESRRWYTHDGKSLELGVFAGLSLD